MLKLEDHELVELIDKFAFAARTSILGTDTKNEKLFDKVQEKGIKLFGMQDEKFDGMCLWDSEAMQPQIYLNVEQPKNRRLFTLAHELGHLFLDYGWTPYKTNIDGNKRILSVSFRDKDKVQDTENKNERIVNEFAGAFLMPQEIVRRVISDQEDIASKVDRVINYFGVTGRAAVNRLIMLGEMDEPKR